MTIITTMALLWLLVGMGCCATMIPLVMRLAPNYPELMSNLYRVAEYRKIKPETLLWWLSTGVLLVGWPVMLWVMAGNRND